MNKQMTAYGFSKAQDPETLSAFEKKTLDVPTPKEREIVVEVKAVSVNPTDLASLAGKNDDEFMVLGRDIAGIVRETGDAVEFFKEGDEVFYPGTPTVQGAQADYHLIDERMVALKPSNLTFPEAAALPLTGITALETIYDRLQLFGQADNHEDLNLLIYGAAGGVGSIASQLALHYGFNVIGTASREESTSHLHQLGVETVLDHSKDLSEQLEENNIDSIDAIFLAVKANENIEEASKIIKPQGRICSILPIEEPLPVRLFNKSVTFSYELMYTPSLYQVKDWVKQHDYLTELKNLVEEGKIQTTMAEHYEEMNEETLRQAYDQLSNEHTVGKIVLEHSKA